MKMSEWAKQEIELACEREKKLSNHPADWQYGCMCYESAMKAFKKLMNDGHSGHSIQITKNILNRLIDGKPLTPIEDTDDVWSLVTDYPNGTKRYQCKRMSALFKDISPDGTVTYNDVDRVVGIEVDNGTSWHSGRCDKIINEMFPIKMPYCPSDKPFKVYMRNVTEDENGNVIETPGCFNTTYLYYAIKPDGERIEINRKFQENEQVETSEGPSEPSCREQIMRTFLGGR